MMWYGNGPWEHGAAWGAGGWIMGIGMIAFAVLAVVLIVYLVRSMSVHPAQVTTSGQYPAGGVPDSGQSVAPAAQAQPPVPAQPSAQAQPPVDSPRDIVQRRYARGEIDREEYLQKLQDL